MNSKKLSKPSVKKVKIISADNSIKSISKIESTQKIPDNLITIIVSAVIAFVMSVCAIFTGASLIERTGDVDTDGYISLSASFTISS